MGHALSRKLQSYQREHENPSPAKMEHTPAKHANPHATTGPDQDQINRLSEINKHADDFSICESENPNSITDKPTRDLLRETWSDDFGDLYELGTDIYSEIFRIDPSTKKLFRSLDNYDLEKDPKALKECKGFSTQALRFVQTISMTVKNSSHLEKIDHYLKDIGRRHVQYKNRGFETSHWHVFETAIANIMQSRANENKNLNEHDRQLLADAYKTLSRYIIATMTIGFHDEEKK